MKLLKDFYIFSARERSGLIGLILGIILLQLIIFGLNYFTVSPVLNIESAEIKSFQKEIDSLKIVKLQESKPIIYPFNPNYITDYKAYSLGLSTEEFDRLAAYRKQNKFVNSAAEFQQITRVNDSLLQKLMPYFKFPDWVNNPKRNSNSYTQVDKDNSNSKNIVKATKIDLNLATKEQLMEINGIGEKLADRIITYRTKLQGYTFDSQLYEVWYLDKEVADKVLQRFPVLSKPVIVQFNINTTDFKTVMKLPYMDYELTKMIFNYKNAAGKITTMDVLKKLEGFPLDKFDRISLYLKAE